MLYMLYIWFTAVEWLDTNCISLLCFVPCNDIKVHLMYVQHYESLQNMHGIGEEVFLSLPCVLNGSGVASVVNMTLNQEEVEQLRRSADTLWGIQKDLKDLWAPPPSAVLFEAQGFINTHTPLIAPSNPWWLEWHNQCFSLFCAQNNSRFTVILFRVISTFAHKKPRRWHHQLSTVSVCVTLYYFLFQHPANHNSK